MAELILTDEERATATYLEWSDEALGKAVKKMALYIQDTRGSDSIANMAAALLLIDTALKKGKAGYFLELKGVTDGGTPIGDWRVTAELLEPTSET